MCIEPKAIPADSPILRRLPEIGEHRDGSGVHLCPVSGPGQRYLEEAVRSVWEAVPDLGGLFNGSFGERPTLCCNAGALNNCPRCSKIPFGQSMAASLSAMRRGMVAVNPGAELIACLYVPDPAASAWKGEDFDEAIRHMPEGVTAMFNFESGGEAVQLGRKQVAIDYWLSYPGPSDFFRKRAVVAKKAGVRMGTIIMIGCSHEVATVSHVPVPELIYEKFQAMRALNVATYRQGWYFGTDPSLMTQAAAELSFAPFPDKETFLRRLAGIYFGRSNAGLGMRSWRNFARAYRNYPVDIQASYYGPAHDGPVWPLHLIPRDTPLNPTWQISDPTGKMFAPAGDRIGEYIAYAHTPGQVLELFRRMAHYWKKGLQALAGLKNKGASGVREITTAKALGIQFDSALNITKFYLYREELPYQRGSRNTQDMLVAMAAIVRKEIANSRELTELCRINPRLGFHAEAEGYKYYPELIQWRVHQLQKLLKSEFPKVSAQIRKRRALFAKYTGTRLSGTVYHCKKFGAPPAMNGRPTGPIWEELPEATCRFVMSPHDTLVENLPKTEHRDRKTTWKAGHDGRNLYVGIRCHEPRMAGLKLLQDKSGHIPYPYWNGDCAGIMIEPRRLWPCQMFIANASGARWQRWGLRSRENWRVTAYRAENEWSLILRIPFASLREAPQLQRPMRIDVLRITPPFPGRPSSERLIRWRKCRPWRYRLKLRTDNPNDLGWLVFSVAT